MRYVLALLALLFFGAVDAHAQDALVVQGCGTLPLQFSPGATRQLTVDVNGRLCGSIGSAIVLPSSLVMSGTYGSQDALIYSKADISGTCSNSGNPCPVYLFGANTFAVNGASGQGEMVRVYANFGGAGQIGGINLFDTTLNVNATTGNSSNQFYVAGLLSAFASVNDGGSGGTAQGSLFAINPQSILNSGATFWQENSVDEHDLSNRTGSSVRYSYINKAILLASNAVTPSVEAGGYIVGMQSGGTATLNCAYCLAAGSGVAGQNAVASTGTLIGQQGATTGIAVARGIDLSSFSFSSGTLIGPNPTYIRASGTGVVQFGNLTNGISAQVGDCGGSCTNNIILTGGAAGSAAITTSASGGSLGLKGGTGTAGVFVAPQADNNIAFRVRNAALTTVYLNVDTSAGQVSLPVVPTGTPAASLCIDASNNIIKKTTTGACI